MMRESEVEQRSEVVRERGDEEAKPESAGAMTPMVEDTEEVNELIDPDCDHPCTLDDDGHLPCLHQTDESIDYNGSDQNILPVEPKISTFFNYFTGQLESGLSNLSEFTKPFKIFHHPDTSTQAHTMYQVHTTPNSSSIGESTASSPNTGPTNLCTENIMNDSEPWLCGTTGHSIDHNELKLQYALEQLETTTETLHCYEAQLLRASMSIDELKCYIRNMNIRIQKTEIAAERSKVDLDKLKADYTFQRLSHQSQVEDLTRGMESLSSNSQQYELHILELKAQVALSRIEMKIFEAESYAKELFRIVNQTEPAVAPVVLRNYHEYCSYVMTCYVLENDLMNIYRRLRDTFMQGRSIDVSELNVELPDLPLPCNQVAPNIEYGFQIGNRCDIPPYSEYEAPPPYSSHEVPPSNQVSHNSLQPPPYRENDVSPSSESEAAVATEHRYISVGEYEASITCGQPHTPFVREPRTPSVGEPHTPSDSECHTPSDSECHTPSDSECDTPSDSECHMPCDSEPRTPSVREPRTPSDREPRTPSDREPHTPSVRERCTPSVSECHTPSDSECHTPSDREPRTPSVREPRTPSVSECHTPSDSECHTQFVSEPHTPSDSEPRTPSDSECHTPSDTEPHTPSVSECHTPYGSECHTPSDSEPYTPSVSEPHTPSVSESCTPSDSECHTPSDSEPHTPSVGEPCTSSVREPRTPSVREPRTPSDSEPHISSDREPYASSEVDNHPLSDDEHNFLSGSEPKICSDRGSQKPSDTGPETSPGAECQIPPACETQTCSAVSVPAPQLLVNENQHRSPRYRRDVNNLTRRRLVYGDIPRVVSVPTNSSRPANPRQDPDPHTGHP